MDRVVIILVVGGGIFLALMVIGAVALRIRRLLWLGRLLRLALILLIPGLLLAGSLVLDLSPNFVQAEVVVHEETITARLNGSWSRERRVYVRLPSQSQGAWVPLAVDENLFDQMRQGGPVAVRYIEPAPGWVLARPADQSTLSLIPWLTLRNVILLAWPLILIVLWLRQPERWQRPSRRWWVLFVGWIVVFGWFMLGPAVSGVEVISTRARAQAIQLFTRVETSSEDSEYYNVPQPFQIVQMRFAPAGKTNPVLAVDVIDGGSVANLEQGGNIAIRYPTDNPRATAIVGATYTHYWKNPLAYVATQVAVVGFCLGVILLIPLIFSRRIGRTLSNALRRRRAGSDQQL